MKKISLIILMVGFGFSLFAQSGKLSEDKRKEFEAQKVAFFTQEMDLTPDEALLIPTVEMVWNHLLEILRSVAK